VQVSWHVLADQECNKFCLLHSRIPATAQAKIATSVTRTRARQQPGCKTHMSAPASPHDRRNHALADGIWEVRRLPLAGAPRG
jgi:hypothetical protein